MSRYSLMKNRTESPFWMDSFFNSAFNQVMGSDFPSSTPAVNVIENETSFSLQLAAPGMQKSDFNIQVVDDRLVISAEKKTEENTGNERFMRKEFMYTSFNRSFKLDRQIDTQKINAVYEDGVLKLHLPKKEDIVKLNTPTQIEIK